MKTKNKYGKRISLIEKYADTDKTPAPEELKEAYGYLDYCNQCGKKITGWDRLTFNVIHGMLGNMHRRKCSPI